MHVLLTGFPGCGKTTVGRLLARRLQRPFVDVDREVVAEHGDIGRIFAEEGEARFRDYEYAATAAALSRAASAVVALGGGALSDGRTRRLIAHSSATTVFLDVPLEVLSRRLRASKAVRPALGHCLQPAALRSLYAARRDQYLRAHIAIEAGELTPLQISQRIVLRLRQRHESPAAT